MRANNTLNCTRSYFNGFIDVYNHNSIRETTLGILKIISYIFIIPPVVIGIRYLKSKKIVDLQNDFDNRIDCARLTELFNPVNSQSSRDNAQKKLIQYLANKLLNFEKNDNEKLEQKRFKKGFKKLSCESQIKFFSLVSKNNCLKMALKWIPKNTEELYFSSGTPNPIHYSRENQQNVKLFLEALPRFRQLKKIELHLRGLGYYSSAVDKSVRMMTLPGINSAHTNDPIHHVKFNGVSVSNYNDTLPIVKTIITIREQIKKFPKLEWMLVLSNPETGFGEGIGGRGTSLTLASNHIDYAQNLVAYFSK